MEGESQGGDAEVGVCERGGRKGVEGSPRVGKH